jgi:hypothetical protein
LQPLPHCSRSSGQLLSPREASSTFVMPGSKGRRLSLIARRPLPVSACSPMNLRRGKHYAASCWFQAMSCPFLQDGVDWHVCLPNRPSPGMDYTRRCSLHCLPHSSTSGSPCPPKNISIHCASEISYSLPCFVTSSRLPRIIRQGQGDSGDQGAL